MNTNKYGETRNKKLIKRRNDITQGWQFCSLKYRLGKRRGKKGKKIKLSLHGGYKYVHGRYHLYVLRSPYS